MIDTQGLEPQQERALIALLNAPNNRSAAKAAGVSEMTLWRYMQNSDFQAAYKSARRDALESATARLQAGANAAVAVLLNVAENARYSPHARVQAAKAVLDLAYKTYELDTLAERIDALEDAAEQGRF